MGLADKLKKIEEDKIAKEKKVEQEQQDADKRREAFEKEANVYLNHVITPELEQTIKDFATIKVAGKLLDPSEIMRHTKNDPALTVGIVLKLGGKEAIILIVTDNSRELYNVEFSYDKKSCDKFNVAFEHKKFNKENFEEAVEGFYKGFNENKLYR